MRRIAIFMKRALLQRYVLTCFIVVFCLSEATVATPKSFDITSYTAPQGWKETQSSDSVIYVKEEPDGSSTMMCLYRAIQASEDSRKNFDLAWQSLVRETLGFDVSAQMEAPSQRQGWSVLAGHAPYRYKEAKSAVILATYTRGSSLVILLIVTSAAEHQEAITAFSDSFSFQAPATPTQADKQLVPTVENSGPAPEVWMVNRLKLKAAQGRTEMGQEWVAFYPNGDYFPYLPEGGFYNFDLRRSGQSWGKAVRSGNGIQATSSYGNITFVPKSANEMLSPDYTSGTWYRCQSVDGLRLEGTYTPDLDFYNNIKGGVLPQPKEPPIITFHKDGTFFNEGISYANVTRDMTAALGHGTYQIKDFSLIMNCAGGRRIQVSFTGIKSTDPKSNPDSYFINGLLNYRLK